MSESPRKIIDRLRIEVRGLHKAAAKEKMFNTVLNGRIHDLRKTMNTLRVMLESRVRADEA